MKEIKKFFELLKRSIMCFLTNMYLKRANRLAERSKKMREKGLAIWNAYRKKFISIKEDKE